MNKKTIITTIAAAGAMLLVMGCGNLAKKDLSSADSVSCVVLTTDTDINTYLITYKEGTIQTTYGFRSLEFDSLLYNCLEQISIDNRQLFDTIICIKDSLLQRTDMEQIHNLIAKTSDMISCSITQAGDNKALLGEWHYVSSTSGIVCNDCPVIYVFDTKGHIILSDVIEETFSWRTINEDFIEVAFENNKDTVLYVTSLSKRSHGLGLKLRYVKSAKKKDCWDYEFWKSTIQPHYDTDSCQLGTDIDIDEKIVNEIVSKQLFLQNSDTIYIPHGFLSDNDTLYVSTNEQHVRNLSGHPIKRGLPYLQKGEYRNFFLVRLLNGTNMDRNIQIEKLYAYYNIFGELIIGYGEKWILMI